MVMVNADVITLIIDGVTDRGTLYSLLAVNREIFRTTCRTLYRDPLRFFRDKHPTNDSTRRSKLSLLQLLLSLSPATDDNTNAVCRVLDVALKHAQEPDDPPTRDYLSLVECIRWGNFFDSLHTRKATELLDKIAHDCNYSSRSSFLKSTLTWSICGHQLGRMLELELEVCKIGRFTNMASQLSRLRIITIAPSGLSAALHTGAVCLVQAIQRYHGMHQLQDCRLPASKYRYPSDADFLVNADLMKLLPPMLHQDLKLTLPLRPMDGYLSRITALTTIKGNLHQWDMVTKDYSDMLVGKILQRCRALVTLILEFALGGIDDPTLLAWAANEAHERAVGRLSVPPVPLRELSLSMEGLSSEDASRVLMDAFYGFHMSLCKLRVTHTPPMRRQRKQEMPALSLHLEEPWVMRGLISLMFKSTAANLFNPSLLLRCPHLTELVVILDDHDLSAPLSSWPVLHLPCLTRLGLKGRAANLFDPTSLHSMQKLTVLQLSDSKNNPSGEGLSLLNRWTWNWRLPELIKLDMEMNTLTAGCSLKALRSCPKLQRICLQFFRHTHQLPHRLEVLSIFTNPSEDIFPELWDLHLNGQYCIYPEDFQALMGCILPNLLVLTLGQFAPCNLDQVVEFTHIHPTLQGVTLRHVALDEAESQDLGLFSIDPDDITATEDRCTPCIYALQDETGAIRLYRRLRTFPVEE